MINIEEEYLSLLSAVFHGGMKKEIELVQELGLFLGA